MEREIKFRAWDEEERVMSEPFGFDTSTIVDFKKWSASKLDLDDNKRFTLMQYTGLKDKNGKEIYEGDIVGGGVYYGWPKETGLGIVKYGQWQQDGSGHEYNPSMCLGWYIETIQTQFNYDGEDVSLVDEPNKHKYLSIIGNIYENPELLITYATNPK